MRARAANERGAQRMRGYGVKHVRQELPHLVACLGKSAHFISTLRRIDGRDGCMQRSHDLHTVNECNRL